MKAAAPLARMLIESCEDLRARAVLYRAATSEEVRALWPLSADDGEIDTRAWVMMHLLLKAAVSRTGGCGVLDTRGKLLYNALTDESAGVKGTTRQAYSKSYDILRVLDHVWGKLLVGSSSVISNEERKGYWAHAHKIVIRIATHPGPSSPFRDEADVQLYPPWLAEMSPEDSAALFSDVMKAFELVNQVRCEAILDDHMRLVEWSATEYVPQAFRELSELTEIDPRRLMADHSYASCLALSDVASGLKGVAHAR